MRSPSFVFRVTLHLNCTEQDEVAAKQREEQHKLVTFHIMKNDRLIAHCSTARKQQRSISARLMVGDIM